MRFTPLIIVLLLGYSILSCRKSKNPFDPNDNNNFTVTNTWSCDINGVHYSGTVDTSIFDRIPFPQTTMADTLVICTGTSDDKKANIHFYLWINRKAWGHDSLIFAGGLNRFTFDTSGMNYFRPTTSSLPGMVFKISNFSGTKIRGSFYGEIMDPTAMAPGTKMVTNGEISFDIGHGANEPKFFSHTANNTPLAGYIKQARHISNTLIMDGFSFHRDSTFQLMVRTGSQIRPGIYESSKGEVGLQVWRPSIVTDYVSDTTAGNFTVNIQSVNGDIITGTYSGMAQGDGGPTTTSAIANGKFKCRVQNYTPQQDSANKWNFSKSNGIQSPYHIFGGNVLSATKTQVGPLYYLTVQGESDHGLTTFKIKISSNAPLTTGLYPSGGNPQKLDSLYFNRTAFPAYQLFTGYPLYCHIDSLDNEKVVGRFYGDNYGNGNSVRKGYFRARF